MAGSVTFEYSEVRRLKKVTFNWTASAAGAVSGINSKILTGTVVRASFAPGTGASTPTNGYTVVINDAEGIDILQGFGKVGLSDTTAVSISPKLTSNVPGAVGDVVIDEKLEVIVAGAGNAKTGKVCLYIE